MACVTMDCASVGSSNYVVDYVQLTNGILNNIEVGFRPSRIIITASTSGQIVVYDRDEKDLYISYTTSIRDKNESGVDYWKERINIIDNGFSIMNSSNFGRISYYAFK